MNCTYRRKAERVDFDTECGDVLLLELARQMALDEGGLLIRLLAICLYPLLSPKAASLQPFVSIFHSPCRYRHRRQAQA